MEAVWHKFGWIAATLSRQRKCSRGVFPCFWSPTHQPRGHLRSGHGSVELLGFGSVGTLPLCNLPCHSGRHEIGNGFRGLSHGLLVSSVLIDAFA